MATDQSTRTTLSGPLCLLLWPHGEELVLAVHVTEQLSDSCSAYTDVQILRQRNQRGQDGVGYVLPLLASVKWPREVL